MAAVSCSVLTTSNLTLWLLSYELRFFILLWGWEWETTVSSLHYPQRFLRASDCLINLALAKEVSKVKVWCSRQSFHSAFDNGGVREILLRNVFTGTLKLTLNKWNFPERFKSVHIRNILKQIGLKPRKHMMPSLPPLIFVRFTLFRYSRTHFSVRSFW